MPPLQPINYASLGEKLFRALNLRGEIPNDLDRAVSPSVQIADYSAMEYAWLGREKRYIGTGLTNSNVATNARAELRNLPGSGLLVVVDEVRIHPAAATGVGIYFSALPDLLVPASPRIQALDTRQEPRGTVSAPTPATLLHAGTPNALGIPATAAFFSLLASEQLALRGPWVLLPDTYLRVHAGTTNVGMEVTFFWRERNPAPSEVSPLTP